MKVAITVKLFEAKNNSAYPKFFTILSFYFHQYSPTASRYTEDFVCSPTLGMDMIARIDMKTLLDLKCNLLQALLDSDAPKVTQRFLTDFICNLAFPW